MRVSNRIMRPLPNHRATSREPVKYIGEPTAAFSTLRCSSIEHEQYFVWLAFGTKNDRECLSGCCSA